MRGEIPLTEDKILGICQFLGLSWQELALQTDENSELKKLETRVARLEGMPDEVLHLLEQTMEDLSRLKEKWGLPANPEVKESSAEYQGPRVGEENPLESHTGPMPAIQSSLSIHINKEKSAAGSETKRPWKKLPLEDLATLRGKVIKFINHDAPRPVHTESLPFYDAFRIPAGPPSAIDADSEMDVSSYDALHHLAGENRYIIRILGDSMAPRIQPNDLLMVNYRKSPRNNDVVVAVLNGESMVKRYRISNGRITLHSDNEKYAPIAVGEEDTLYIAGVLAQIVGGSV